MRERIEGAAASGKPDSKTSARAMSPYAATLPSGGAVLIIIITQICLAAFSFWGGPQPQENVLTCFVHDNQQIVTFFFF